MKPSPDIQLPNNVCTPFLQDMHVQPALYNFSACTQNDHTTQAEQPQFSLVKCMELYYPP